MSSLPLLTILTFLPLLGGLLVVSLGEKRRPCVRWLSLGVSLGALALTFVLCHRFDPASGDLQFQERHSWIPALGVE